MMSSLTSTYFPALVSWMVRGRGAAYGGAQWRCLGKASTYKWPSSLDSRRINCTILVALIGIPIKMLDMISWFRSRAKDSYSL